MGVRRATPEWTQRAFGFFKDPRGGPRPGVRVGRKPAERGRVTHARRPAHDRHEPVHVTMRVRRDLPRLRQWHLYKVLREAFRRGREQFGFRLIHYSVQSTHVHLLCEADDRRALSRGMQGLAIRAARALNRKLGRKGKVFIDRYHAVALDVPLRVRNALVYVFTNARHHDARGWHGPVDTFSSAAHFDGWRERLPHAIVANHGDPVGVPARTWLLTTGWRRHGALGFHEAPRS
jgi:REP element-mobilizing transposase RayT